MEKPVIKKERTGENDLELVVTMTCTKSFFVDQDQHDNYIDEGFEVVELINPADIYIDSDNSNIDWDVIRP